ncbi:signal transduction histidine kinase [Bosea sp. OAE506]|uniref:GAF domain-containing protein n=1 Tax=Bosea sp. OAE506 TaxID=2663870 RepID=UPI0019E111EA
MTMFGREAKTGNSEPLDPLPLGRSFLGVTEFAPSATIVVRGPDQVVECVNSRHRQLFNSTDWLGSPLRDVSPSSQSTVTDTINAVMTSGVVTESTDVETVIEADDTQAVRYLRFVCGPMNDDPDRPPAVICQGFDVTASHHAELRRAVLAALGEKMREVEDADELAFAAAEILGKALHVGRAGYGTIDVARETIHIERDWTMPGVVSLAGTLRFRDYGSYIDDLKMGRTVVFDDAQCDPRTVDNADALEAIQARSVVNMPVTELGGFVALLYLNHFEARHWTKNELALIGEVAALTRNAVARRRAEEAVRCNEARLRFLDALGKATAASTQAEEIMAETTRALGEHLNVSVCAYADMDEDQNGFTIRGDWSAAVSPSIVGHYKLADFGKLAVANLGAGQPLVLHDIRAELEPAEAATFLNIGLAATICMPLVKRGLLTALMAIHNARPRRWTDDDLALLTEVTERCWAHIERVRSEASVREGEKRFREELEAKVAERTQALQQVQKMEAVGNLTGGIAHDFNNLLMAVIGSLELLRKRMPADQALLRLLDNAMEGAKRGSSLTQRMLAFARRQELRTERTDAVKLVQGMQDLIQRSLGPMVNLRVRLPKSLPAIEVDGNQLEAALLNLAVNARDAMPDGGTIIIEAKQVQDRESGQQRVCLSVSDDGEGMDEGTLARATEPFFTTKGVGKGTGLGLSMVYGFAEQSGGRFSLTSEVGRGTTAEIILPISESGSDVVPVLPTDEHKQVGLEGRRLTILAVDDDALVLMNTGDLLEDLGHDVVLAHSGREALDQLSQRRFDLVITDHAMPQMTGAQLISEIEARSPELPVILATGYAELPSGLEMRDVFRLSKPFAQQDLVRAIAAVVTNAAIN